MAAIEIRVPTSGSHMDDCSGCDFVTFNATQLTTTFNTTQLTNDSSNLSSIQIRLDEKLEELNLVEKYAFLVWYVIGVPANFLAFAVWIQSQMINSSGCYMAALALTDNIFLILHFAIRLNLWVQDVNAMAHPVACQVVPTLYTAAQYLSGLLVLQFTVEQYIAICHPFKRSRYCRVSIAKKIIVGGIALVIALGAPQAYFFELEYKDKEKGYVCDVRASLLKGAVASVWSIWTWVIEMIMFGVVPISCLVLNIRVIYEVMRQANTQLVRHYSTRSTRSSSKQARKHGTTTVMLLAVSLYWVCTEIPATVVLGLMEKYTKPNKEELDEASYNTYVSYVTATTTINILSFSRYSCKLFIYLATGKQFRKHLRFFRRNQRLNRQASDTTMTSVATRTLSYRRNKEESRRAGILHDVESRDKFLPSESSYSKLSMSQPNSPIRESWGDDLIVDVHTALPSESSTILNNNNNCKFP